MQKFKLKNGLTIVYDYKPTASVTIQATVDVGSVDETKEVFGISHFIEHMLFEGTKKRPNSRIISNEIESIGGEINAYTSNERTCFYVKVPKKNFSTAADIIADIIENPLFTEKNIDKERQVILKEINLRKDEPRFYQWVLFQKTLFKGHPAKNPTYGTIKAVKNLKREDILDYYNKYYCPDNIVLSIVGNVKDIEKKLSYFNFKTKKSLKKLLLKSSSQKQAIKKEQRNILSSYMILGYQTPDRLKQDSYTLDVIHAILGKGQSGRLFEEIRNKRGLAYEVGAYHEPSATYGFFAVYLNTAKSKINLCKNLILKEFEKLNNVSEKELKEAKGYLEGKYLLDNEDTQDRADTLGFWESVKDSKLAENYIQKINSITLGDIKQASKKYFTQDYTMIVIEQS